MKTGWRIFFGVVILVLLVYLLRDINFGEVYTLFVQADNIFLLLAFLSFTASILVFNLKGIYSISTVVKTGYWFNLKTTLAGFFVNTITPGAQLGGDPVRAYFLGKRYRRSKTKIFGAILADRVVHALVSLFFIFASVFYVLKFIPVSFELRIIFQTILFSIVFIFVFIGLLNFNKTKKFILETVKKIKWLTPNFKNKKKSRLSEILSKHLGNFTKTFTKTLRTPKVLFAAIILSFTYWILTYLVSYFLFLSFGIKISFFLVLVVVSLSSLVGDFSPSPGGAGLVEGFMVIAYSVLGINFAVAFAVSLLSRAIYYFYSIILGGLSLVHLESSFG